MKNEGVTCRNYIHIHTNNNRAYVSTLNVQLRKHTPIQLNQSTIYQVTIYQMTFTYLEGHAPLGTRILPAHEHMIPDVEHLARQVPIDVLVAHDAVEER